VSLSSDALSIDARHLEIRTWRARAEAFAAILAAYAANRGGMLLARHFI
jgi:hypothetical protein